MKYIVEHVQMGEPIPVPRPPPRSLATVLDLEQGQRTNAAELMHDYSQDPRAAQLRS